jgi:hypothetical protein
VIKKPKTSFSKPANSMFMLRYEGRSSNLEHWLKNTDTYLIAKFAQAGNFITSLSYSAPAVFDYAAALQDHVGY